MTNTVPTEPEGETVAPTMWWSVESLARLSVLAPSLHAGRRRCRSGFLRGRRITVRVGGVFDGVRGGFVAVAGTLVLVAEGPADGRHHVVAHARAFDRVPPRSSVEEPGDGRLDRIHRLGRRGAALEGQCF